MNYELIETAAANFLAEKFEGTGIVAISYPETESEHQKIVNKNSIVVAFAGEKAMPSETTDMVVQKVKVSFAFLITSRFLRGNAGVYSLASLVKKLITGKRFCNYSPFQYVSHDLVSDENNFLGHRLIFDTEGMRVQVDEDEVENLLKKLTFNNNLSDEEVQVQ